jgi:hypothetical protein
MKWEYLTANDLSDEDLNSLGEDGWELISKIFHPYQAAHSVEGFQGALAISGGSHMGSIPKTYFMAVPAYSEFVFKRPEQE